MQFVGLAALALLAPGAALLPSSCVAVGRRGHRAAALFVANVNPDASAATTPEGYFKSPRADADTRWSRWPVLPLAPYARRKTVITEVVPGRMWTFDQLQGALYVHVPVRMTVVKLGASGAPGTASKLFVFAPVAPTQEVLKAVRALEAKHGAVAYVVLPTDAVEHKAYAGVFALNFKKASVWHTAGQYSYPLDLPMAFLGYPVGRTRALPTDPAAAPWATAFPGELDYATLGPFKAKGVGGFGETAFFHKPTKTLLTVDAIVKIPTEPPAIMKEDPRALIYHARDDFSQTVVDTPAVRLKGWKRVVLFGLYFMPEALTVVDTAQCFEDAKTTPPAMKSLGWNGLFPFEWNNKKVDASFAKLQAGSGLLVAPILQTLILNRNPEKVLAWADRVAKWPFTRIVPCHLESPIQTTPADFRAAFGFLEEDRRGPAAALSQLFGGGRPRPVLVKGDLAALEEAEVGLVEAGSLFERGAKVSRR
jgi:hypothetical protein